jgi:hypothetical protein
VSEVGFELSDEVESDCWAQLVAGHRSFLLLASYITSRLRRKR